MSSWKKILSFGFCPNRGGGEGLPKFFGAFLVNKGVYFFQNANKLNLKQFFGCIFIVFLVLNWLSNLVQVVLIGGREGGGWIIWIKSKKIFFSQENVPKILHHWGHLVGSSFQNILYISHLALIVWNQNHSLWLVFSALLQRRSFLSSV